MQPCARRAESGFTIIEFLIAVLILVVGLFGLLTSLDVAMKQNVSTKLKDHAVVLAEQFLADNRSVPLVNLANNVATRQVQVANAQVTYTITTTVATVTTWMNPDSGAVEPLSSRVTIDVTWLERGQVKHHAVTTYISNTLSN